MATYTRRINLYINGQQVQADIKSIHGRMTHLQRQIRTMTIGSREYVRAMSQIRHLRGIIDEHNARLRVTAINLTSLKGLANAFNKYWPMIMGSIGSFIMLTRGVSRSATDFAVFEDAIADVMKVTGLTRDQVVDLNEELKKIDTRTSQENLMELAWVAGKLGYDAAEDVLGFVNAADKLNVALAKDLGGSAEEAIRQIGKMVEVFNLKDIYGIEDAMIRVGSAINELGMASTAQEQKVIDFTQRVSGIAPAAGVSIEKIMGLGATIDMLALRTEVSATAYSRLMTTLARDTETMARITGMSIAEWNKLFEEDANEAMLLFLETVGSSDAGFQHMINVLGDASLEGQRLTQVLGVLAKNTDKIREQQALATQAFAEGTSVINEFNIKNNNAQAIIEKKQKDIANLRKELGERLFPVYMEGLGIQERFMRGMAAFIEFIYENRRAVLALIAGLLTYKVTLLAVNKLENMVIITGNAFAAIQLKIRWAYYMLTNQIVLANKAQLAYNTLMLKTPWGAIFAGISAIAVAIFQYRRQIKSAAEDINKAWGDVHAKQSAAIEDHMLKLDMLFDVLKMTNPESERRRDIVKQINELYPDMLKGMDAEKASLAQLELAYKRYVEQITKAINQEILMEELRERRRRLREIDRELEQLSNTYLANGRKWKKLTQERLDLLIQIQSFEEEARFSHLSQKFGEDVAGMAKELAILQEAIKQIEEAEIKFADTEFTGLPEFFGHEMPDGEWISIQNEVRIAEIRARIEELTASIEDAISGMNRAGYEGGKALNNLGKALADFSAEAELAALNRLMKQYTDGQIETLQEYQEKEMEIRTRFARGRYNQADKDGESYLNLQKAYYELLFRQHNDHLKNLEQLEKDSLMGDPVATERLRHANILQERKLFGIEYENMTKEQQAAYRELVNDHHQKLNDIDAKLMKDEIDRRQKAHDIAMAQMELNHQQQLQNITTLEEAKIALAEYMSEEQLRSIRTLNQAKRQLQKIHDDTEKQKLQAHLKEMITLISSAIKTADMEGVNLSDAILSDQEYQLLIEKLLELQKLWQDLMDGIEETTEGKELRGLRFDIFGFTQDDWDDLFDNLKNAELGIEEVQMALIAMSNAWQDINQIITNSERRKLQEYEKINAQSLQILETRLEAGFISEEYYNHHRQRLEDKLERKKAEVARRQAVRERNVALMQAIVNTAAAVTKALPNPILAAIVAAAGALQIGIITSTPLPQIPGAEKGGYTNVVRSQDGKQFRAKKDPDRRGYITKPTILTGEHGKKEYVIPNEGVENPQLQPIIQMIEQARVSGRLPQLNPQAENIMTVPGREQGGFSASRTSSTAEGAQQNAQTMERESQMISVIMKNSQVMENLQQQVEKGIVAYVTITGRNGIIERMKEYDKIINKVNM